MEQELWQGVPTHEIKEAFSKTRLNVAMFRDVMRSFKEYKNLIEVRGTASKGNDAETHQRSE